MTTYSHSTPLLDITQIAMALSETTVGHTIEYHRTVTSTMSVAHDLAVDAASPSGVVVVAEEQSAGLGRLRRHWEAPLAEALLVSLILKAPHLPTNGAYLPMMAGVAVVRAIATVLPELTADLGLKWPNDILLGEDLATGRKVGGILIECSYLRNQMDFAIVGIGVNVNQGREGLPKVEAGAVLPTSLRLHVGRVVDRSALLIALCQAWNELLGPYHSESAIYYEWRNLLLTLGQPVTVRIQRNHGASLLSGTAVDVTQHGELVVLDDEGQSHILDAGDVTTRLT